MADSGRRILAQGTFYAPARPNARPSQTPQAFRAMPDFPLHSTTPFPGSLAVPLDYHATKGT